jgi:hypothetical protein
LLPSIRCRCNNSHAGDHVLPIKILKSAGRMLREVLRMKNQLFCSNGDHFRLDLSFYFSFIHMKSNFEHSKQIGSALQNSTRLKLAAYFVV